MSILVKWGKERLHITLPPPDTKLGVLRQSLSDYSHIPPQKIKLIFGGGVMKDDNASISAFGIHEGITLHMVGSSELPPSSRAPATPQEPPARPTETSLISQIEQELQRIRKSLLPPLEEFLISLDSPSPPARSELEREHIRLGELLLQSLLRLDALAPEGGWEDARRVRKGAVKEVQSLLDKLDGGWQESRNQLVE